MDPQDKVTFESRFDGLEKDPVFLRKRKATVACFMIRMVLLGAEYAIILPSIWLYLQRFNVQPWFLGIVVAIYPISAVISLPVVGRLFDKTKRMKEIILLLNTFEIVGNIVYALPFSPWLIFAGRFFAGFGDGFYAIATSEIIFTFPVAQRTGIFALLELGRVLGLTFAPALNFFLSNIDFKIGEWSIDFGSSPGLFMALLWILVQVITLHYVSNLSLLIAERSKFYPKFKLGTKVAPVMETPVDFHSVQETSLCESTEYNVDDEEPLISQGRRPFKFYKSTQGKMYVDDELTEEDFFSESHSSDVQVATKPAMKHTKLSYLKMLLSICTVELMWIFYADLVLWLVQTEFEVFLPLITQEDYGWGEIYVSVVYIVGGVWLMVLFALIYKFGNKTNLKDQHYIVISLVLTICALLMLICEQIPDENDFRTRIGIFICICVIIFTAIPLNLVAFKSLISKLTPREHQGVVQGLYSAISRISLIAGPIIASTAFSHRVVFGIMMCLLCIVALIAFVLNLSRIRRRILAMEVQNR